MPSEIRRLVFDYAELTTAVQTHAADLRLTLPMGKLTKVHAGSSADYDATAAKNYHTPLHGEYNVRPKRLAVVLTFFDQSTMQTRYTTVTADFIASALIDYCRRNNVMLPKAGEKHIELLDMTVALDIAFHSATKDSGPALSIED